MSKIRQLIYASVLLYTALISVTGWAHSPAERRNALAVEGFAGETPPGAPISAAYLTLHNSASVPRSLHSIALPRHPQATASLHATELNDGVSRMRALDAIEVPAQGSLKMRPGGIHVMLTGVRLSSGNSLPLQLIFADGEVFDIILPVASLVTAEKHQHQHH